MLNDFLASDDTLSLSYYFLKIHCMPYYQGKKRPAFFKLLNTWCYQKELQPHLNLCTEWIRCTGTLVWQGSQPVLGRYCAWGRNLHFSNHLGTAPDEAARYKAHPTKDVPFSSGDSTNKHSHTFLADVLSHCSQTLSLWFLDNYWSCSSTSCVVKGGCQEPWKTSKYKALSVSGSCPWGIITLADKSF